MRPVAVDRNSSATGSSAGSRHRALSVSARWSNEQCRLLLRARRSRRRYRPLRFCSSRVGVVEQVAAAHDEDTDETIGAAVAETSPRPRRAPH